MAFTEIQTKALKAKLRHRWVKTRESQGSTVPYVEGWHAIAEANRIFGFDSWDRQTMSPQLVWSGMQRGEVVCFYSTKVRITVRAGGTATVREGIGTGLGRSTSPEIAHETALKAAETDATKRALATFGNPFGLALYDRDQSQVTKPRLRRVAHSTPGDAPLVLKLTDAQELSFESEQEFVTRTLREIESLGSIDDLFAFWSANLAAFTELRRRSADEVSTPAAVIINVLKARSRQLARPSPVCAPNLPAKGGEAQASGEATALLIPKEKRIRDRDHLEFIARQPCVICGRKPSHSHHLRFAQARAMGLKVSDEYTLPLCNIHHDEVHRTGDERAWWARHGVIEPLKYAARLWGISRQRRDASQATEGLSEVHEGDVSPAQQETSIPALCKARSGKEIGAEAEQSSRRSVQLAATGPLSPSY